MATEYMVLRRETLQRIDEGEDPPATESVEALVPVSVEEANDADQAIVKASEKTGQPGAYVAVPTSRVTEAPVEIETEPRAKIKRGV